MDIPERSEASERELVEALRSREDRQFILSFIKDFPADCRLVLPVLKELAATGEFSYEPGGSSPEALARALAAAGAGGVDTLREMAASDNPAVKQEAIRALGRVADPDGVSAAVEVLVSHLRADDPGACDEALESLARLGPNAAAAVPRIVPLFSLPWGNNPSLPKGAAYAAGKIGPPAAATVPALLAALAAGLPAGISGRYYVIEALGKIGLPSADAVPHLLNLIDTFVRTGTDESDEGLDESLDAQTAIYALAGIGVVSPEVMATLERAWRTPGCSIARNAPIAIAMLDPADPRPLAWLIDEIEAAADPEAKSDAICTLGVMRPDGRGIRKLLARFAADENLQIRIAAEVVLEQLPPDGP